MMAFTAEGQLHEDLVRDRDARLGVCTERKRRHRADIPEPEVAPGANGWESGQTVRTRLEERDVLGDG